MKEIVDAIYAKYNADAALKAAISGGLYNTKAKQNVAFPYGVFFLISDVPDWTFTEEMENFLIQFNLFSKTSDTAEIHTALSKLMLCYDWSSLTVTGYTHIYMKREFTELLNYDDVFQYSVRYRCEIQK